jgi:hypothetical protein
MELKSGSREKHSSFISGSRDMNRRSTVAVRTDTEFNSGNRDRTRSSTVAVERHRITTMAEKTDTGAQKLMVVASLLVARVVT